MTFLADMAQIVENAGFGTQGTDLFYNETREDPDNVILLKEYAGEPPNHLAGTRSPGLQVSVRNTGNTTGRELIESIYNYLDLIGDPYHDDMPEGILINGTLYLKFKAVQEPFPLGPKDEKGRRTFVQNFIVTYGRI